MARKVKCMYCGGTGKDDDATHRTDEFTRPILENMGCTEDDFNELDDGRFAVDCFVCKGAGFQLQLTDRETADQATNEEFAQEFFEEMNQKERYASDFTPALEMFMEQLPKTYKGTVDQLCKDHKYAAAMRVLEEANRLFGETTTTKKHIAQRALTFSEEQLKSDRPITGYRVAKWLKRQYPDSKKISEFHKRARWDVLLKKCFIPHILRELILMKTSDSKQ